MDIQFCDNCENFMFIYLDSDDKLLYKCKNCNFQKKEKQRLDVFIEMIFKTKKKYKK